MKVSLWTLAGLLTVGTIAAGHSIAQQPQRQPIEPLQNDVRPPSGRVNPNRPIQVRVVSLTKDQVVASLQGVDDRPLAPGRTVTFGQLHTKYLQLPMDLQVSLVDTPDPNNPVGVFLNVTTSGNQITVGVKTTASSGGNASQSVSVNENGLIYVY